MTDQQKGVFYYHQLPFILMCAVQIIVVNLLIFDRNISLLEGIVLTGVGLVCLFLQNQLRSMISKQATIISATELSTAVILKRQGKLDDALYAQLVRKHFDTKAFQRFTALGIDVDMVANNQGLQTYDDVLKFYATQLVRV